MDPIEEMRLILRRNAKRVNRVRIRELEDEIAEDRFLREQGFGRSINIKEIRKQIKILRNELNQNLLTIDLLTPELVLQYFQLL